MPDDVRIEHASPDDFESLVELHVRSWRTAYAGMVSDKFLATEIEDLFREWRRGSLPAIDGSRTWVARSSGVVVGFADTGPSRDADATPTGAELYTLHVAPDYRGRGLGRTLLACAIDDLERRGYRAVTAWVLEPNARARRFYESLGWRWDGHTLNEQFGSADLREVRYLLEPTQAGSASAVRCGPC